VVKNCLRMIREEEHRHSEVNWSFLIFYLINLPQQYTRHSILVHGGSEHSGRCSGRYSIESGAKQHLQSPADSTMMTTHLSGLL
jgi:hypothetical protein